jgi:hybrid polyketide synthase/nonribosomal peptide synthetase FtdB
MFILLAHRVATEQYGYRLDYIELPEEEGQFDLTMSAYEDESEGRFHCVFKYNTDLFLASTVERMATHFVNLLNAMLDAPEKSVATIEMLSPSERKLMLREWSGSEAQLVVSKTIVDMIRVHEEQNPKSRAVALPLESGEVHYMSYGDLAQRTDQLAHNLSDRHLFTKIFRSHCRYFRRVKSRCSLSSP